VTGSSGQKRSLGIVCLWNGRKRERERDIWIATIVSLEGRSGSDRLGNALEQVKARREKFWYLYLFSCFWN